MSHEHFMKDTGNFFEIDPATRQISTVSGTSVIMQGDHRSEIITFEMPRYFDLHDMLLCNRVEVHYINVGETANEVSDDVYDVKDMAVSEGDDNKVRFTWTIDGNGTIYAGKLTFSIQFKCTEGDELLYRWGTAIYDALTVAASYDNLPRVAEEYSDIIATWDTRIKQIQSDWNAKEGEPGHVKNRTHWVERSEKTVLEESMKFTGTDASITEISPAIEHGKTYVVEFDGKTYTCVGGNKVTNVNGFKASAIWLGNASLESDVLNLFGADVSDTGEPFLYIKCTQDSAVVMDKFKVNSNTAYAESTVPLKIVLIDETVHKLPGKFLPEGVPYAAQDAEILPLTEFAFYEDMNAFVHTQKISLTAGETYRVIYNGQEYMSVCNQAVFQNMPVLVLGNLVPIGGADTGEPFSLGLYGDEVAEMTGGIYLGVFALDGAESVSMAIYGVAIGKLDNRCLDLDWDVFRNRDNVFPNATLELVYDDYQKAYRAEVMLATPLYPEEGKPYTVYIDDVPYDAKGYVDYDSYYFVPRDFTEGGDKSIAGKFLLLGLGPHWVILSTEPGTHSFRVDEAEPRKMPEELLPESVDGVVIRSSTEGSTKKFLLTVNDSGTISVTEVTA